MHGLLRVCDDKHSVFEKFVNPDSHCTELIKLDKLQGILLASADSGQQADQAWLRVA